MYGLRIEDEMKDWISSCVQNSAQVHSARGYSTLFKLVNSTIND